MSNPTQDAGEPDLEVLPPEFAEEFEEEPEHEYDPASEDFHEDMADEPGLPDELVAEIAEEPPEAVGFNTELAAEAMPLLIAALLAIVLTEGIKPWVKAAMRGREWQTDSQKRVLQTMPFIFGTFTSSTFGFRIMVLDLTGVSLSVAESLVYGGASVGVVALVLYEFIHSIRPIKVLRLRFYKLVGVSQEEVDAPTLRKQPPVDPDNLPDE